MATVTELVTKFVFLGDHKPLEGYNAKLAKSIKLLVEFTAVVGAAAIAGAVWAAHILETIDPLEQLSKRTRIAIGDIQALDYAAEQNGSSAEAMNASLEGLSRNIGLAANGMGRGKEIFAKFGISLRDASGHVKTASQVLDELRDKWNKLGLTIDEREALASRLGIDPSLARLLMTTNAEMGKLMDRAKQFGVLTEKQGEAAEKFKESLDTLDYAMNAIKQQVAVGLAPAFTELIEQFTSVIAENKDWIIKGIKVTTDLIGQMIKVLVRVAPILAVVGLAFAAARIYALGFAGAMALVNWPVTLTVAAIVALILIVDDLIVAFRGGDSVIGKFAKNVLGIDLSHALVQFHEMWKVITDITSAISRLIDKWAIWLGMSDPNAKEESLKDFQERNQKKSWQPVVENNLKPTVKNNQQPGNAALIPYGPARPLVLPQSVTAGANMIGPKAPQATTIYDNRKVEQSIKMDVRSTDPNAASREITDGLQRQLKDANAQLGVGGQ